MIAPSFTTSEFAAPNAQRFRCETTVYETQLAKKKERAPAEVGSLSFLRAPASARLPSPHVLLEVLKDVTFSR